MDLYLNYKTNADKTITPPCYSAWRHWLLHWGPEPRRLPAYNNLPAGCASSGEDPFLDHPHLETITTVEERREKDKYIRLLEMQRQKTVFSINKLHVNKDIHPFSQRFLFAEADRTLWNMSRIKTKQSESVHTGTVRSSILREITGRVKTVFKIGKNSI